MRWKERGWEDKMERSCRRGSERLKYMGKEKKLGRKKDTKIKTIVRYRSRHKRSYLTSLYLTLP